MRQTSPIRLAQRQAFGPFIPEVVLPSQVFSRSRPDTPEMRLMLRVLEQALDDLRLRANGCTSKYHDDAMAWFLEEDDAELFSFEHICAVCGFDAESIRTALRRTTFMSSVKVTSRRGTIAAPSAASVDNAPRSRPRKRNTPRSPLWES